MKVSSAHMLTVIGSRALSAAAGKLELGSQVPADHPEISLHSTMMPKDLHLQYTAPGIGRFVPDNK